MNMKRTLKRLLLFAAAFTLVAAGVFYIYLKTLPTRPPRSVAAQDLNAQQPAQRFQCTEQQGFNYAYDVSIEVESQLNNRVIYTSGLHFKTQLSQANDDLVKGVATDIRLNEGGGDKKLDDVYFLSRIDADPYAMFTAYNNLGLAEKHPMSVIAQLLKSLSVGREGETYRFAYDSLQRNYSYNYADKNLNPGGVIERTWFPATTGVQKVAQALDRRKSNWRTELDQRCVPVSVSSEEHEAIAAAGHSGFIKFRIEAKRIPDYVDVGSLAFNAQANAGNRWELKTVNAAEFEDPVANRERMWAIINGFADNKNTAQLAKAAEYMIDNISALELSGALMGDDISDTAKRDLIFGLGITGRDDAEAYMLDALTTLPVDADSDGDLQKVRLMVAVSGNGKVTAGAYETLSTLVNNPAVNDNVRSNAMINMGTVVQQLDHKGQGTGALQQSLTELVTTDLQNSDNAAAAIMAAGNARLSGVDQEILSRLSSTKVKERYASGMVLSRNTEHYDVLIEHIGSESSNLVNNAIITNMKPDKLSGRQRAALETIAAAAEADKANLIRDFLQ